MTEKAILQWIKKNLSLPIQEAIPGTIYTEDWLGAIPCREVGVIIARKADIVPVPAIWELMRGDYTQRKREKEKQYHGFSPWQIDTGSFPLWISQGKWKDPYKAAVMAVSVLESKRKYITSKYPQLSGDTLNRAITAAYNTGEGNVVKSIGLKRDVDTTTANGNYSAHVWRLREIYRAL